MAVWLLMTNYKEISCKVAWNFVKEVAELLKYFSDLANNEPSDRTFFGQFSLLWDQTIER